ncbi:MAG: carboxypeptidase-like regulatory domain-containing protein [bacterium]
MNPTRTLPVLGVLFVAALTAFIISANHRAPSSTSQPTPTPATSKHEAVLGVSTEATPTPSPTPRYVDAALDIPGGSIDFGYPRSTPIPTPWPRTTVVTITPTPTPTPTGSTPTPSPTPGDYISPQAKVGILSGSIHYGTAPYPGKVTVTNQNGDVVASVSTDSNGTFSTQLAPGTYTVSAGEQHMCPDGSCITATMVPYAVLQNVTVYAGVETPVSLHLSVSGGGTD